MSVYSDDSDGWWAGWWIFFFFFFFILLLILFMPWSYYRRADSCGDSLPPERFKFGFSLGTLVQLVFAAYISDKYASMSAINVVIVIMVGLFLLPGYVIATLHQNRNDDSYEGLVP